MPTSQTVPIYFANDGTAAMQGQSSSFLEPTPDTSIWAGSIEVVFEHFEMERDKRNIGFG
jgi:hypothetical protein